MSTNKSHHVEGQNQTGNDTNQNKEVTASVNSTQTHFSLLPTLSVNIKNILGEKCQVRETKTAEETIIHWVQGIHFQEEIESIKKQISLSPKSPLRSLHPFINEHGLVQDFIPPSPHFGGIWESGIRSVKFHLKRVLGETILTLEKLTTLLTQIKGLLNSRPLSYINDSDIECISTLTPSHFLTGDVLLSVPEELPSTSNHRDRWKLLQNIKRSFWKKWSSDFLSSLQPRKKWQYAQPNLKDDIVLIKEEGPPGTWPIARVLQVHPSNDGLVRVATVKTKDSIFKRPVHKLLIYPN
ncbi:DUF5641 domain-containing protein [Trichonephila clavipes]|nr:DUF5641 domain-containing protein [Trichonephila clavipes]